MPVLSKKKLTKRNPPRVVVDPERDGCVFPEKNGTETRTFRKGEIVCYRFGQSVKPATYVRRVEDRHEIRYARGIASVEAEWYEIGKFTPKANPALISQIARQKNLPEDIERKLKTYGGRRTRRRRRTTSHA